MFPLKRKWSCFHFTTISFVLFSFSRICQNKNQDHAIATLNGISKICIRLMYGLFFNFCLLSRFLRTSLLYGTGFCVRNFKFHQLTEAYSLPSLLFQRLSIVVVCLSFSFKICFISFVCKLQHPCVPVIRFYTVISAFESKHGSVIVFLTEIREILSIVLNDLKFYSAAVHQVCPSGVSLYLLYKLATVTC